jgi:glycine cleavage system H lipoate-binding protein
MEGDIYATKGIEYLIVIGYLLVMVGLAVLAARRRARHSARQTREAPARVGPSFPAGDGYRFHPGHAWVARKDGSVVTVGLDDFTARVVGEPDGFELPSPGSGLRQGAPAWKVRANGRVLPMLSPVEGEVVAVNQAVLASPRLAADDPYGQGWLLKVRTFDGRAGLRNLIAGELASLWMQHSSERLRRLPTGELGVVMPDGGTPVPGLARTLEQREWEVLAREFFLTE